MIKSCLDCLAIATTNRNPTENEEAYGLRLNGDTQRAPPWPTQQVQRGNMFLIPIQLKDGDKIHISGVIRRPNPQKIFLNLVTANEGYPDYSNVPLQLEINIAEDKILAQSIYKNSTIPSLMPSDEKVSNYMADVYSEMDEHAILEVSLRFIGSTIIAIDIGSPDVARVKWEQGVEHIRFLTIQSDLVENVIIHRLAFDFAQN